MQKIVWTETQVEGPKKFQEKLAQPQAVANYYEDITVMAFPTPEGNARIPDLGDKAAYNAAIRPCPSPAAWPDHAGRGNHRPGQSRHADREDGQRREAHLGRAGGQVDDPSHRPHLDGQGKSSHARLGLRFGMRQDEQRSRRSPFRRPDGQNHRRSRPAGGQIARGHAHRQLGKRLAKLDAQIPRGVQEPPRLRSDAVFPRDDRPDRRQPRNVRAIPLGRSARPSTNWCWKTTPGISAKWPIATACG